MAESYINIRYVIDKLMQHPLLQGLTLEQAVGYTIDFMRIVGVPSIFLDKIEVISIENYRAVLPCDYYKVIQVRDFKTKLAFRATTDSFYLGDHKHTGYTDFTYKIQGNIIYTSIAEGTIEFSYKAINIDEEGYPLIPDNSSFTRALELFIKKSYFTILFDLGKISPASLQNVQQEYAWAVGDCESEFNRLSLDEAESFYNSWRTLLIRDTEHQKGFLNMGTKEYIKLH